MGDAYKYLVSQETSNRRRGNGSGWIRKENSSLKSCQALTQAAQGGGGVPIPTGVQEPWRCGAWEYGQWAWGAGLGLGVSDIQP